MDPTSFASILAGVKRMREQYDGGEGDKVASQSTSTDKQKNTGVETGEKRQKVIESGGQQKSDPTQNEVQTRKDAPNLTSQTRNSTTNSSTQIRASSGTSTLSPTPSQTPRNTPQSQPQVQSRRTGSKSASPPIGVGSTRVINAPRANTVQMYSQIQVSPSQKGNPLFQSPLMKSKPVSYNKEILSDYYINPTLQVLFLSLKYHQLHPEYVWRRCKKLNQGSTISTRQDNVLKVLLVVIDIENPQDALRKLNTICIRQDLTLLVAWSFEQAGNYIAMLKENELSRNKVNLSIKGVKKQDIKSNLIDSLTTIKSINKTDVVNLLMEVGSFKDIAKAKDVKISGLGDRKVQNLREAFSSPFMYKEE